jgi:hypothetical protein
LVALPFIRFAESPYFFYCVISFIFVELPRFQNVENTVTMPGLISRVSFRGRGGRVVKALEVKGFKGMQSQGPGFESHRGLALLLFLVIGITNATRSVVQSTLLVRVKCNLKISS